MNSRYLASFVPAAVLLMLASVACGGDSDKVASSKPAARAASTGAFRGKKVDVKMISDSKGERYDPVEIEVERGDSLRFVLASGVHNVHFMPDKNPAGLSYPPVGPYLQLPGQIDSYLMDYPEGRYYFQCDIHVLIGMKGYVKVEVEGSKP